jgi:hypothetical protein
MILLLSCYVLASFYPVAKAPRETAFKPITSQFQICSETSTEKDFQLVRTHATGLLIILLLLGRVFRDIFSSVVFACRIERNHFYRKLSIHAP